MNRQSVLITLLIAYLALCGAVPLNDADINYEQLVIIPDAFRTQEEYYSQPFTSYERRIADLETTEHSEFHTLQRDSLDNYVDHSEEVSDGLENQNSKEKKSEPPQQAKRKTSLQRFLNYFHRSTPKSFDRELMRVQAKFDTKRDMHSVHKFISFVILNTPENPTRQDADKIVDELFSNDDNLVFANPSRLQAAINMSPYLKGISITNYLPYSVRFLSFLNRMYHDLVDILPNWAGSVLKYPVDMARNFTNVFLHSVVVNGRVKHDSEKKMKVPDPIAVNINLRMLDIFGSWIRNTILSKMPKIVSNIKTAKAENFVDMTEFSNNISTDGLPGDIRELIFEGIATYFDRMPYEIKRNMFARLLEMQPENVNADSIAEIIMEGGPVMQKLLQLIGENTENPALKKAMLKFKSNITPMKPKVVQGIIKALYKDNKDKKYGTLQLLYDPVIGSASIGQVHTAQLTRYGSRRLIAVKVQRPDAGKKAEIEKEVLGQIVASKPGIKDLWNDACKTVDDELDYVKEIKLLEDGYKWYHVPEKYLNVPKGLFVLANGPNQLIAMDYINGTPLHGITRQQLEYYGASCRLRDALDNFASLWFETVFFKPGGFFHGDPHSGNLIFDFSTGFLNIIDFGNTQNLNEVAQKQYLSLILGIHTNNIKLILDGFGRPRKLKDLNVNERRKWELLEIETQKILEKHDRTRAEHQARRLKRRVFWKPQKDSYVPKETDYDPEDSPENNETCQRIETFQHKDDDDDTIAPQIQAVAGKLEIKMPPKLLNFVRAKSFIVKAYENLNREAGDIFIKNGCTLNSPTQRWASIIMKKEWWFCAKSVLKQKVTELTALDC